MLPYRVSSVHVDSSVFAYRLFLKEGVNHLEPLHLFLHVLEVRVHGDGQVKQLLSVGELLALGLVLVHLDPVRLHQLHT